MVQTVPEGLNKLSAEAISKLGVIGERCCYLNDVFDLQDLISTLEMLLVPFAYTTYLSSSTMPPARAVIASSRTVVTSAPIRSA